MKQNQIALLVGIVGLIILGSIYFSSNKSFNTSQNNIPTTILPTPTSQPEQTKEDHLSSYLYAFINTLSSLYNYTQESNIISEKYASSDQYIQQTATMLRIDSDLSEASAYLQPYINDSNEAIQASAALLYVDIMAVKNANKVVMEEMRTATPDTLNPTQIKYDIAKMASAQEDLKNDLLKKNIIFIITKGLIQLPVDAKDATGPIKYSLSATQRQDHIENIKRTFGTAFDNYSNNVYLLAAKVIQMSLTFETYEEQKSYKLN